MSSEMFRYDEHMAGPIFEYCRKRLSFDPVTLDFAGEKETLDAALAGLMLPEGNDPASVLNVFVEKLAPAVISCDSPRFLAFIPAAPTRASMLFDMVVSCSSLQGTSWLEAAGAVAAENQALRVLADLAGLPAEAGGVFVSGGSAANLSALAVARDTARRRMGRRRRRLRVAVSDQTHSSVGNALRMLDMAEFPVPTTDHRMTGENLRAALADDRHRADVVAVVATAGTTNAGIVDDLAGIAEVAAEHQLWFHVDGAYGVPHCSFPVSVTCSRGSSGPTRSWSIRTSGSSLPSTAPRFCTGIRRWPERCTRRTPATSMWPMWAPTGTPVTTPIT